MATETETTFRFKCPACGKRLYAPLSRAKTRGKCSACGKKVKIPPAQFTHVELVEWVPSGGQVPLPPANLADEAIPLMPPMALTFRLWHVSMQSLE